MGRVENDTGRNPSRKAHILMLPFEEQGHFGEFLQLLYFLSSFDVVVTVCSSSRRVKQLRQLLSDGEFKDLDLRLVLMSDDISNTADKQTGVIPKVWEIPKIMKVQFQTYRAELASETNPGAKPTCMVVDMLLDWSAELADELQIPRYALCTTGGWGIYTPLKWKLDEAMQHVAPESIVEIPGQFSLPAREVPSFLFPLVNFHNLAGILINTYEELEGETSLEAVRSHLEKIMPDKSGSKIARYLPIGPTGFIPAIYGAASSTEEKKSKALEWLDEQAASSVVYVAFGTMVDVPPALIRELARGLELGGAPFLWVLRSSNSSGDDVATLHSLLPPGFLERVGSRGYIETGWAPQLAILQHQSTGAFLSHCGWNSSMEAVSAGVPVLTWPLGGDQPVNARFIVDALKVGLPVRKLGSPSPVVTGEDVAATIKSLVEGEEGKAVRKNSLRCKELAAAATREGGSSHRNLHRFIDEVLGTNL